MFNQWEWKDNWHKTLGVNNTKALDKTTPRLLFIKVFPLKR